MALFGKTDAYWDWGREAKDFLRATAAACIFGIPLLYTMEMWWNGLFFDPARLLGILAATLAVNVLICLFLGFRREHTWPVAVTEAVTSIGIGVLLSSLILLLIGEIPTHAPLTAMAGKVVILASLMSLGVSATNAKFHGDTSREAKPTGAFSWLGDDRLQLREDLKDAGAGIPGAAVLAVSIAPTEEVLLIASRLEPIQLLLLFLSEIVVCYLILFASGFWCRPKYLPRDLFQSPFVETVLATTLSIIVAGTLMFALGPVDILHDGGTFLACTVVLGLPAVVGGAAARLVL